MVISDALPFYNDEPNLLYIDTFWDRPADRPPPGRHSGEVDFDTFLTSWDGTLDQPTETVTLYGLLHWGFKYECVPEPSVRALGVLPVFLFYARRWCFRRSQGADFNTT